MNNTPWIKWYSGDFLNGVADLSPHEIALYTVILCRIYDEDKAIPHDLKKLARRCNMRMPQCEKALNSLLSEGKLTSDGTFIDNKRASKERQKRLETSAKQSVNASKGWQDGARKPNKNNGSGKPPHSQDDAKPMPTRTRSQNQIEKSKPKKKKFDMEKIKVWYREKGLTVSIDLEYEKWGNWREANGKNYKDETAAFRNWLLKAQEFSGEGLARTAEQSLADAEAIAKNKFSILRGAVSSALERAKRYEWEPGPVFESIAKEHNISVADVEAVAEELAA